MAEETPATDAPATPADDQQPATPAAEPEAKAPEGEAPAPAAEPDKPSDDAKPTDAEALAEAEPPKDDPETPPEAPEDPKEVARRSFAERQRLKTQAQAALRQQFTPATEEQLVQQGYDPERAEVEALRQRVEASEFVSNASELTANISTDALAVESEFSIFNEKSPDFDKDFAEKVSREYLRDAQVQFDQSGNFVTSARIPMYDYYKSRYDDRMAGQKQGQVSGQKAAERMLASAETPSSATPPPPPAESPIDKGMAEVFGS